MIIGGIALLVMSIDKQSLGGHAIAGSILIFGGLYLSEKSANR